MAKSHTPRGRSFSNDARTSGLGGGRTTSVRISLKRTTWDWIRPSTSMSPGTSCSTVSSFGPGGRGQLHRGIERNQRGGGIARIDGVTQPPAHRGMVITVVADRAVAKMPAVSPARIAAAQILAPDFLQQVTAERRCIAQLRRRDHVDGLHQHRVALLQQIGVRDLGQLGCRADLHAAPARLP